MKKKKMLKHRAFLTLCFLKGTQLLKELNPHEQIEVPIVMIHGSFLLEYRSLAVINVDEGAVRLTRKGYYYLPEKWNRNLILNAMKNMDALKADRWLKTCMSRSCPG